MSRNEQAPLVQQIVGRRAPRLLPLLSAAPSSWTAELLLEVQVTLASELVEHGLAEDGEPTEYGRRVDDAIGWLSGFRAP